MHVVKFSSPVGVFLFIPNLSKYINGKIVGKFSSPVGVFLFIPYLLYPCICNGCIYNFRLKHYFLYLISRSLGKNLYNHCKFNAGLKFVYTNPARSHLLEITIIFSTFYCMRRYSQSFISAVFMLSLDFAA